MSLRIAANQPEPTPEQAARREAMLAGFDGDPCPACGKRRVVRSGQKWICNECCAFHLDPRQAGVLFQAHVAKVQAAAKE